MAKTPERVSTAISEVENYASTQWAILSKKTAESWTYTVKVRPKSLRVSNRKAATIDLKDFFSKSQFPKTTQVVKFSEVTGSKLSWRDLSSEELRLIQLVNFKLIKENQKIFLGNDGNKYRESVGFLNDLLKQLKTHPIVTTTNQCANLFQ